MRETPAGPQASRRGNTVGTTFDFALACANSSSIADAARYICRHEEERDARPQPTCGPVSCRFAIGDATMKLPIDVATRVSQELGAVIEAMVDNPEREEPPTLDEVRQVVSAMADDADRRDEAMHPQERASVLREIDDLVDEFGGEALAVDFLAVKASEELSRIIEVAMENPLVRHEPTLGAVRDAMANGLMARLVGDGTIEPDQDQTLLAEIDGLVERHGSDAVAEDFVRFE